MMALTVRDVLSLDIMKNFKIVAGEKGLDKTIVKTEILDFEFVKEGIEYRKNSFEGQSLVLTSFLFAKDNPKLIVNSVKKLIEYDVHALAYKPIFFKKLPEETLELADKMKFPILEFGDDEYFEDIIFSIMGLKKVDETIGMTEPLIERMIKNEMADDEKNNISERINPLLRYNTMAVCLKVQNETPYTVQEKIKKAKPDGKIANRIFVGKYKDRYMMVLSSDDNHISSFKELYDQVCTEYGLKGKNAITGRSTIRNLDCGFERIFYEAYWAERVAEIEGRTLMRYENMGVYKLITAHGKKPETLEFVREYFAPLVADEQRDVDLMKTAVQYVLARGDIQITAEKLFCHKNTVRYRIGKLQEKLDPCANEKEFYQNLSTAVKIYLVNNLD